ncbi:MAG: zinc ribbon domain-containing protein [Anaerolineae bacterium]|nr:zinc ribbon domain-containing protein [Anaerolineae bacterium]
MDAPTLIGGFLLVGGALALVLYPLWQRSRPHAVFTDPTTLNIEDAQARYEASLVAIKELMFDYDLGKIAEADYEPLLTKAKLTAAQTRRHIDRLTQEVQLDPALETTIERQVAALKSNANGVNKTLLAEIKAEIDLLKTAEPEDGPILACSNCGRQMPVEAAFCSSCGQALTPPDEREEESTDQLCPKCGYTIQPEDAFCAGCGTAQPQTNPQQTLSETTL